MIHYHTDCIFDRSPVGMGDLNVHVSYELVHELAQNWPILMGDCSADLLPNRLVGVGLKCDYTILYFYPKLSKQSSVIYTGGNCSYKVCIRNLDNTK